MLTLPDYLGPGLRMLSVGLNPSIPSLKAGFYFANPRNRFWRALQLSRLVDEVPEPGAAAMETLFQVHAIGFTDLVKRPTPGAKQLRADDYRQGAPLLLDKIQRYRPAVVWFHGKLAWHHFLRYGLHQDRALHDRWGEQNLQVADSPVYVTPNTSPANAAFSLDDLVAWYDRLAAWLEAHHL